MGAPPFDEEENPSRRDLVQHALGMPRQQREDDGAGRDRDAARHPPGHAAHPEEEQGERRERGRDVPPDPENHEIREHPDRRAENRDRLRELELAKEEEGAERRQEEMKGAAERPGRRERQQETEDRRGMEHHRLEHPDERVAGHHEAVEVREPSMLDRLPHGLRPRHVENLDVRENPVVLVPGQRRGLRLKRMRQVGDLERTEIPAR
jgi:hypothetical protein